jgi:hypothetical protein
MRAFWCVVCLVIAMGLVGCGDDESMFQTENCSAVTDFTGETYTLCCRVTCTAEYDYDDYKERCTEQTSCTSGTGSGCPLRVLQATPACLY